ncbi:MAG: aldo/keto reductase [Oscillospiraceae bacterium]|nr:aldo/keto reductase [Oscillospiraceae bacterium]
MNKDIMIGTWAWGSGYNGSKMVFGKGYDEETLKSTFEKAVELGFVKWDTAAVYGMGSCERLLGSLINGRDDIFISTKSFPNRRFRSGALEKSFAESLERLVIKSADLFWIHLPNNLLENLK